jgi:hypothetical protein
MKCSNIRKEIDRWIYQHEPEPVAVVIRHLDSCEACSRYLEETRLAAGKIAGLRRMEPILEDPEGLTEDIMRAIRKDSNEIRRKITEKSGILPRIIILRRLLAAASVCFFLVFGYEEYVVVNKISRLEKQNAAISQSSQYQAALKLKMALGILASDPGLLNRYKELKTKKINLMSLFRAAIYADMAGINPDTFRLLIGSGYEVDKLPLKSFLKQFDSTHHKKQR